MLARIFATFVLGLYPISLSAAGARIQLWRFALLTVVIILTPEVVRSLIGRLRVPRTFSVVGGIWLGWGLLSFAWTPSFINGAIELIGLFNGSSSEASD